MNNFKIKTRHLEDDFVLPIEKGGTAISENTTEEDKERLLNNLTDIGLLSRDTFEEAIGGSDGDTTLLTKSTPLETFDAMGVFTVNSITFGTEDLVPGESELAPGHIYFVIE